MAPAGHSKGPSEPSYMAPHICWHPHSHLLTYTWHTSRWALYHPTKWTVIAGQSPTYYPSFHKDCACQECHHPSTHCELTPAHPSSPRWSGPLFLTKTLYCLSGVQSLRLSNYHPCLATLLKLGTTFLLIFVSLFLTAKAGRK